MIQIKDLLQHLQDALFSEENKIEAIRSVVSEIIKVPLDRKDIKIKNNVVFLNIKPIYKNEISLKKDLINLKLRELLGKKSPENIF